jgi:hypothetical protein
LPQKVAAPGDNEAQTSEHAKRGGKDPHVTEERGVVGVEGRVGRFRGQPDCRVEQVHARSRTDPLSNALEPPGRQDAYVDRSQSGPQGAGCPGSPPVARVLGALPL